MAELITIAPNAEALGVAGGIEFSSQGSISGRVVATCHLCAEWTDGTPAEMRAWGRLHAYEHDALRPSVLGVDPSLRRAGLAIVSVHADLGVWPTLLTHHGEDGHENATYDERGDRLVRQARALMGTVDAARRGGADIRLAVIEGPIPGMSAGHAFDRGGLWWSLYTALRSRGIPVAVVTPAHREKFIAGVSLRPNARTGLTTAEAKRRIVDETRARWAFPNGPDLVREFIPKRLNHDQADALGLADMGALHLDWPLPWQKRRRHVENVALVEWPQVVNV